MDDDFCEPTQPISAFSSYNDDVGNLSAGDDDAATTDPEEERVDQQTPEAPTKAARLLETQNTIRSQIDTTPYVRKRPFKSFTEKLSDTRIKSSPATSVSDATETNRHTLSDHLNSPVTQTTSRLDTSISTLRSQVLGTDALPADVRHAAFCEDHTFGLQELVLVPRSDDRFVYGRVMSILPGNIVEVLLNQAPPLKKWLPPLTVGKMRSPNATSKIDRPKEILHTIQSIRAFLKRSDASPKAGQPMTNKLRQTCLFIMASLAETLDEHYQFRLAELSVKTEENAIDVKATLPSTLISKVRLVRKRALELVQYTST
eukprot:Blabericola_migrator_1__2322@NODE_1649_length_4098_cov_131_273877_g1073_i0_p2_GENE_NODE_1649_length_4098_cov_131_273877_g1073_i0NODE_1649_length_4098_cov_131_273877_g1073_i0_p2_ORF_typecomplete_len316_score65_00_NODE_1649_length_4098_cov_131_273877_g1073_i09451892